LKKEKNKKSQFLTSHLEDFLILFGLIMIAVTTFIINWIYGMYVTAIILLVTGIYFTVFPIDRG